MAEAMQDTNNVGVAKGRPGGYAVVAPAGFDVSVFADMTKTLSDIVKANKQVQPLGYISEDGVEFSTDTSSEDKSEWGGTTIDSSLSSYAESAAVTFLESRESVLKTVYGDDNVTTDGATTTIRHNANFTDPHVFAFDAVISSTKVKRSVIPVGRIFERDSVTENSSDLMGYKPTIKCMPYAGYDGDAYRDHIYDSTKAVPGGGESAGA